MRWIMRTLAVVGLLCVLILAAIIVGLSRLHIVGRPPVLIANVSVLTLTVDGPLTEAAPMGAGFSAAFTAHGQKLRDVIDGIDRATVDPRVKGLILKIDASAGMAQTQELRAAIKRFRDGAKFVYAYADDYRASAGNGAYYLAAACDQIWLQPMGEAMIAAVAFESPFFKDALGKFDIEPEFVKRSEYKTAPETFTERGFTAAAREMMESLANDLTIQLVSDLANSRKLESDQVRGVMARGPLTADEALEAKLVDRIGYADEVVATALKAAGDTARLVPLDDYDRSQRGQIAATKPNIALIYETGEIGRVKGSIDPAAHKDGLRGENGVLRGFAEAIGDTSVKSIVFRVDSPGGSVSGSESIRRMAVLAKQSGKKLVVSMGATAASGGYWIAVDADKIVADPASLTGSIGVFSGKFVVVKGLNNLGVTVDRTADGGFADMDSSFAPFTADQTQRLNATIDKVYEGFIARVAEGRKLPPATVAQSARGRVWTGLQAKQLGLVDEVGGLADAVRAARELGGIPADQPTAIRVYPEPVSPVEELRDLLSGNLDGASSRLLGAMGGPAGAAFRAMAPLLGDVDGGVQARMPDLGLLR